jgi:hypothetical protein
VDQPAALPAAPPTPRKRRVGLWVGLAVLAVVLSAGSFLVWRKVVGWFGELAAAPWAVLHEAAEAVQTAEGARGFYRKHPGLAPDFNGEERFVEVSRAWAPKLKTLPPTVPDMWTLLKAGGQMNVTRSNGQTSLAVHYGDVSVLVVLREGELIAMRVE